MQLNYHQAVNALIFWDNSVPKRLVQMLNHMGICSSYSFQLKSVAALSKDATRLAQCAANDPSKNVMLPYDNFNWVSKAWETSAVHKSLSHDQVAALLVVLPNPPGIEAKDVTSLAQFKTKRGSRHLINPRQALEDILPSLDDQKTFRKNAIVHAQRVIAGILKEAGLKSSELPAMPSFLEDNPIPPHRTEEYYLPTFDQEQGSTRGNMVVLEHYFSKVLAIPKKTFEERMFTVLGDRLTVARDRAAQDQRAVDTSPHAFDHLSSFAMVGGLMHYEMNFIAAVAGNAWGKPGVCDAVSLMTLQKLLPNRTEVNPKKINYYAWLRFLHAIFQALVLKAAMVVMKSASFSDFCTDLRSDSSQLETLATRVVDQFVIPPTSRLEDEGIKLVKGESETGHAMQLLHDLMTLEEMHDAVKRGHPTRALRTIKFWMPMYYAAGSYNYSNECMETLHNVTHDWPTPYSDVAFKGMFFNPRGRIEDFKSTDIRCEHLNDRVKERAQGPNANPSVLEKVVPAMGHLQNLTDKVFEQLGVEDTNQKHSHVKQQADVRILLRHFTEHSIFEFSKDKSSPHGVTDLYRTGIRRVSGAKGGHRLHLERHKMRMYERHGNVRGSVRDGGEVESQTDVDQEGSAAPIQFTLGREHEGTWEEMMNEEIDQVDVY